MNEVFAQPSGCTWAGAVGNYLCLISLEGGDALPAEDEPQPLLATSEHKRKPWWKFWR